MIVGASFGDAANNAKSNAGESYIIFGGASLPASINLAALGSTGVVIFGAETGDRSGNSVMNVGDVNGDGYDDLLIAASVAESLNNGRSNAGECYLIFGAATLPATIELANVGTPSGVAGVKIFGADANDYIGRSISSAGDVNGDGFDDLIVGSAFADGPGNTKASAGESYLIFGRAILPTTIDLLTLSTSGDGVTIFGNESEDQSGRAVTGAGDVNGDGFDDLLVGASLSDGLGNALTDAGESYLIFGNPALPATIDLAASLIAGVTFFGAAAGDRSGSAVSSAGDLNGDGYDDLVITARQADAAGNVKNLAGDTYFVFWRSVASHVCPACRIGNRKRSCGRDGIWGGQGRLQRLLRKQRWRPQRRWL